MAKVKTIFIISITALAAIIFIQNSQSVIFRILFWEVNMPRIVMMVLIFTTGILIGLLLAFLWRKPGGKKKTKAVAVKESDIDDSTGPADE